MLDKETKQNLEQYLALIESPIVFLLVWIIVKIVKN